MLCNKIKDNVQTVSLNLYIEEEKKLQRHLVHNPS